FGQVYGYAGQCSDSAGGQGVGRANDQVVVVRYAGNRVCEADSGLLGRQGKGQLITEVQELEECLELMVAVSAPAGNVQKQVEFCRRGQGDTGCHSLSSRVASC